MADGFTIEVPLSDSVLIAALDEAEALDAIVAKAKQRAAQDTHATILARIQMLRRIREHAQRRDERRRPLRWHFRRQPSHATLLLGGLPPRAEADVTESEIREAAFSRWLANKRRRDGIRAAFEFGWRAGSEYRARQMVGALVAPANLRDQDQEGTDDGSATDDDFARAAAGAY